MAESTAGCQVLFVRTWPEPTEGKEPDGDQNSDMGNH
jgi:hypothetical protein